MPVFPKPTKYTVPIKTPDGQNLFEYRFDLSNVDITKYQLDNVTRRLLKVLLQQQGPSRVAVMYVTDQQYSTDFVQMNSVEDVNKLNLNKSSFQSYDSDPFDVFEDYIDSMSLFVSNSHVEVGDGEKNNCLPEALRQAFHEKFMPEILKTNEAFKKFVGVDDFDKVDLALLPKIEEELQMNIYTCGQYRHANPIRYPRAMKIKVYKNHVDHVFVMHQWRELAKGYSMKNRVHTSPIVYKMRRKDDTVKLCYLSEGKKGKKIILREPMDYLTNFYKSNPLRRNYFLKWIDDQNDEPEDVIERYIQEAKAFRKSAFDLLGARGCLNPFHADLKYPPIASHYFYKHAPKSISRCDDFYLDEDVWISNAMSSGMMYVNTGDYTDVVEYDVNSMYPALMTIVDFITRKGRFSTVSRIPKLKLSDIYSIYRCHIVGFDNRLFQGNRNGYYCGLDIITAQQEGYDIKLVQDGEPNCLFYDENTRISGDEVFGKFVRDLYKLKTKNVKLAKSVINCLWGKLASKNIGEIYTNNPHNNYVDDVSLIKKIQCISFDSGMPEYKIKVYKSQKRMQFRYSRFVPFLLARGRRKMYKFIRQHKEHVVRVHTDGAIFTKPIDGIKSSNKLYGWKIKTGNVSIKNLNSITWS